MAIVLNHERVEREGNERDDLVQEDWKDCRFCREFFGRSREARRQCTVCGRPFCSGEHGTTNRQGLCVCVPCCLTEREGERK